MVKKKYLGSVVLGVNDGLVELTGALAGLTLALRETKLIAMVGLITGIAASMSMAASEYLSTEAEDSGRKPKKAAVYTGLAYILVVIILISPYLILEDVFSALALTVVCAIIIIAIISRKTSRINKVPYKSRFIEMIFISMGIAAISFGIGYGIRILFGIDA